MGAAKNVAGASHSASVLMLAYAQCGTCKTALKWLGARGLRPLVRAIVSEPPTLAELAAWVPQSGLPIRKWLNTSGQSYRALGKATFEDASDSEIMQRLAADGKLVRRPVLVFGTQVLVGFDAGAYARVFQ
jgi:arsenate reductase (glutaredoxin)